MDYYEVSFTMTHTVQMQHPPPSFRTTSAHEAGIVAEALKEHAENHPPEYQGSAFRDAIASVTITKHRAAPPPETSEWKRSDIA